MPVRDLLSAASTQGALPSDPNFEYNTLLLNGDGTNGAQNNTFLDSSTNNFTITRNGNTTQGSFSPYGTLWSNYFNGSSMLTAASSSDWTLGTGDFTIEAWMFPTSLGTSNYPTIVSNQANFDSGYTNRFALSLDTTNIVWYNTAGNYGIVSNSTPQLNVWTHVAIVRSSSTITMYVNGVAQTQTQTSNQNYSTTNDLYIGGIPFTSTSARFFGNISNLRIVKGSAVYTSNFTPSTTPLTAVTNTTVLTCQSNRFVDNSSIGNAITVSTGSPQVTRFSPFNPTAPYSTSVIGGSGYFDSSSYLSFSSSVYDFGIAEDYSVEFFVYFNSLPTDFGITGGFGVNAWSFGYSGGNSLILQKHYVGTILSASITLKTSQWYNIVICRQSGTQSIFVNGIRLATGADATSYSATTGNIGWDGWSGWSKVNGYMSDVRILTGASAYNPSSSTITVPTAPVTAITNTALLTSMTNAGIPDLAMQNNLETVGDAQVSTSVKKYGTGSLAFDSTGDALSSNVSQTLAFGTGNFTVEFWLYYPTSTFAGNYVSGTFSSAISNALFFQYFGGSIGSGLTNVGGIISYSWTPSTTTWYHIALVRNSNTLTLYIDGTSVASGSVSASYGSSGTYIAYAGPGTAGYLNANLDDLRISKFARYTANFTPPTSALPTY